jgi:hypothetical protein
MIAALYVQTNGCYFGSDDVDPWDEARDARRYAGPHSVVAHPPCARWCQMAGLVQHRYGHKIGDDGGTFKAALESVRKWGGVLEHPAYSIAFERFGLPSPIRNGWTRELFSPGWVTEVSQSAYGHRARKRTWLYYVGPPPPLLDWSEPKTSVWVSWGDSDRYHDVERMGKREQSATPEPFRKLLLELATLAGSARGEPQA